MSATRWLTGRRGDLLAGLSLFVALYAARTMGVAESMWLLGDQIRDWRVALRPIHDLPLDGPASVAGGNALGPYYYWLLWAIRAVIGPWFDNLPHAGVYGLAVLHAAADVAMFFAVRRVSGSPALALATVLLVATAPYDLALSSTIWSPGVAVSLIKIALALFLVNARHPSMWRVAATVAVAWLAVQSHSSLVLVFVPLAAWFVVRELASRAWRRGVETARVIVEVVLVLQIPYIVDRVIADAPRGGPSMIVEGVMGVVGDPLAARPLASFDAISGRVAYLWAMPAEVFVGLVVAALAAAAYAGRRRPELLFASALPLMIAVAGFAAWTRPYESYWFMGLSPSVALLIPVAVSALPAGRWRDGGAVAVLVIVLAMQPARLAATRTIHRMPQYGALVDGARDIARRTGEVSAVRTAFELPATADPAFPFECMGGRVTRDAAYEAVIGPDGVTYRPVPR